MDASLFRPMEFGCPPGIQAGWWMMGLLLRLRLLLALPRADYVPLLSDD